MGEETSTGAQGVDEQLRSAFGALAVGAAARGGATHLGARDRMLRGLRHRRTRRLRAVGGAVIVLAALAIALPQVLSGPASSPAAVAGSAAGRATAARCAVGTRTVSPCGQVLAGTQGAAATPSAVFSPRAPVPGTAAASHAAAAGAMVVAVGQELTVTLPPARSGAWRAPQVHSRAPAALRRAVPGQATAAGARRFVFVARRAGTAVLEARGPSGAVWELDVEVRAR